MGGAGEQLTERERLVADHVASGRTNKEVAVALGCSPRTVEHHLSSIYAKLGVRSRAELGAHLRAGTARVTTMPRIRYARSGSASIAWYALGEGAIDVLLAPGFVSHLEVMWEEPRYVRVLERIAEFARVICFDKRGTGLSDPLTESGVQPVEHRIDDIRAVLDAAGSERAVLFGWSEGGAHAALFASTHPERVGGLLLHGAMDAGPLVDPATRAMGLELIEGHWGEGLLLSVAALSISDDPSVMQWMARLERQGASPAMAATLVRMFTALDIRDTLSSIDLPTTVIHRVDDPFVDVGHGRRFAAGIPGARYHELPGADHVFWTTDTDLLVDELRRLVDDAGRRRQSATQLLSILRVGTSADEEQVRRVCADARVIAVDQHGTMVAFDRPGAATQAARRLVTADPATRAAIHVGECSLRSGQVTGPPLRTAAALLERSGAGEILVTGTVRDLTLGSALRFEPRGSHRLDGSERVWEVLAVA